jgi:Ca2+-transporting ATPase
MVARLALLGADALYEKLQTGPEGLSADEAAARLRRFGPNHLPRTRGPNVLAQLLGQLTHFFALMLWAASVLAFVGGMPQLGWAIIAVVVVNGLFTFVQEYRAERATRLLASLLPSSGRVVREGHREKVPAEDIVPGDVLVLEEGVRISCDARLVTTVGLKVDNSMLTGEPDPAERTEAPLDKVPDEAVFASNLVFAGTYVVSGSGTAVVAATGPSTRLASIARLTTGVARRPTPLHLDLNRSVRIIAAAAVGVGLVFFAISQALGMSGQVAFLFAVGVIVALVPEGLLPTLTLSMAMGAQRMARRGALVRHLEAVGDPGRDDGDLHRQDRDADRQPDDGRGGGDASGRLPGHGLGF